MSDSGGFRRRTLADSVRPAVLEWARERVQPPFPGSELYQLPLAAVPSPIIRVVPFTASTEKGGCVLPDKKRARVEKATPPRALWFDAARLRQTRTTALRTDEVFVSRSLRTVP